MSLLRLLASYVKKISPINAFELDNDTDPSHTSINGSVLVSLLKLIQLQFACLFLSNVDPLDVGIDPLSVVGSTTGEATQPFIATTASALRTLMAHTNEKVSTNPVLPQY